MKKKNNKIIWIVLIVLIVLILNKTIDVSHIFSVSPNMPSFGSLSGGGGGG